MSSADQRSVVTDRMCQICRRMVRCMGRSIRLVEMRKRRLCPVQSHTATLFSRCKEGRQYADDHHQVRMYGRVHQWALPASAGAVMVADTTVHSKYSLTKCRVSLPPRSCMQRSRVLVGLGRCPPHVPPSQTSGAWQGLQLAEETQAAPCMSVEVQAARHDTQG
jgi:hypothetical protein